MGTCKVCEGKIVLSCRCPRCDVKCENGHEYHYSPFHNEYHHGTSDHSTDTMGENCCEEKKKIE